MNAEYRVAIMVVGLLLNLSRAALSEEEWDLESLDGMNSRVRVFFGAELGAHDLTVITNLLERKDVQRRMTEVQKEQLWRVTRRAAEQGAHELLVRLETIAGDPDADPDLRWKAIQALRRAKRQGDVDLFRRIALDMAAPEGVRASALNALTAVGDDEFLRSSPQIRTNASGAALSGEGPDLMSDLEDIEQIFFSRRKLDDQDIRLIVKLLRRKDLRRQMTEEQEKQLWLGISRAAEQGADELLNQLQIFARDPMADAERRGDAIRLLRQAQRPGDAKVLREVALDAATPADVRRWALHALACVGDEEFLVSFAHSRTNQSLTEMLTLALYVQLVGKIRIARDQSLDWSKRRDAIRSLASDMMPPGFVEVALEDILKSDSLHAEEITRLRKEGQETLSQKSRQSDSWKLFYPTGYTPTGMVSGALTNETRRGPVAR
jgi:hypothetical protein